MFDLKSILLIGSPAAVEQAIAQLISTAIIVLGGLLVAVLLLVAWWKNSVMAGQQESTDIQKVSSAEQQVEESP